MDKQRAGHGVVSQRGDRIWSLYKRLVAGCAPLTDENRGDRKEVSSLQGFHAVYFTPCSSAPTHTHTHTRRTSAESPVTVCVNEMLE